MSDEQRIERARGLMTDFAERTGVRSGDDQQRYLWTDAFAVCNLLGLARTTGDDSHRELALTLIDRVHHTLGRHRDDDPRTGWLGEASEEHPTLGGLRIGKPFPERSPDEPFNQRLEWDRDGQYFHYLTKWMYALDQATRVTGRSDFNAWARELMETAHRGFAYGPEGHRRMHWKMSIDLSRPLVPSQGHHDPLDGYITAAQLERTAAELAGAGGPTMDDEVRTFAAMIEGGGFATDDPLGLGGLLSDAHRVEQLMHRGFEGEDLLEELLQAGLSGLGSYARQHDLDGPAERRLAFRELGLAIGLEAVRRMLADAGQGRFAGGAAARERLEAFRPHLQLGSDIVGFWLREDSRRASTWTGHRDINEVMLATALAPGGYLELPAME